MEKLTDYCGNWSEYHEYDMVVIEDAAGQIKFLEKQIKDLKWSCDSKAREIRILKDKLKETEGKEE